jgi:hypothetical protein
MPLDGLTIATVFVASSLLVFSAMGEPRESLLVSSLCSVISATGLNEVVSALLSSEAVVNFWSFTSLLSLGVAALPTAVTFSSAPFLSLAVATAARLGGAAAGMES